MLTDLAQYWWSCYMTYAATMVISKASIGCFLLRIVQRRSHRWIIYIAMGASTVSGALFFFAALFQCWPVSFVWDKSQPGHCFDMNIIVAVTYTYSAFSIVTDFTFTILPLFLVSRLMVDPKTKAAIVPFLSMACL